MRVRVTFFLENKVSKTLSNTTSFELLIFGLLKDLFFGFSLEAAPVLSVDVAAEMSFFDSFFFIFFSRPNWERGTLLEGCMNDKKGKGGKRILYLRKGEKVLYLRKGIKDN